MIKNSIMQKNGILLFKLISIIAQNRYYVSNYNKNTNK